MADEPTSTGATPGIDMDALGAMLDTKIQDSLGKAIRANTPPPQPRAPSPPPAADPIGDMVRPYIEPHLRASQLLAEAANDKADFYSKFGNEVDADERAEVEKTFTMQLQNGRPMSREDILAWQRGKDPAKLVEKANAKTAAKLAEAQRMADVGGGKGASGGGPAVEAFSMDHDALTNALKGASF